MLQFTVLFCCIYFAGILPAISQQAVSTDYQHPVNLGINKPIAFFNFNNISSVENDLPLTRCYLDLPSFSSYFEFTVPESGNINVEVELTYPVNFGMALYEVYGNEFSEIICNYFYGESGNLSFFSNYLSDYSGSQVVLRFWTTDTYTDSIGIFITEEFKFPEASLPEISSLSREENLVVQVGVYTPEELVQDILTSGCVEAFNVQYTGHPLALGYFSNASTLIGLNDGIIMSTGLAANAVGPNVGTASTSFSGVPGDADLSAIVGANTFDAAVLEFDFIPASDTVMFKYVFASEEYPRFVNSAFNDVFAFLISGGPENYDKQNIALIPGTETPVTINNVNHLTNSQYYIVNLVCSGMSGTQNPCSLPENPINIQYNGFTRAFMAFAEVTACETYQMKLAIADVADRQYDSAVFLEAGSFISGVGIMVESYNQYSIVVEPVTETYYVGSTESDINGSNHTNESYFFGNTDSDENGAFHTNSTYFVIFDVYSEFTLVSVEVNANSDGNRQIQLRNSDNQIIETTTVFVPEGVSRVNVGFDIPPGTGYQLRSGDANPGLWRNNAGVSYPYTVENVASITGSNASPNHYYFYYDWEIEVKDYYLIFDAMSDFSLISVEVNADVAGDRTILLRDDEDEVIESTTVFAPQGISRVDVGFDIPTGNNYKLVNATFPPDLWRNDQAAQYPYTVENIVSITGSNISSDHYYFYYDWEIEVEDAAPPVPIMQGCSNYIQFCRSAGSSLEEDAHIFLGYGGTAVPGVHYSMLPNNFIIPHGEQCLDIEFTAFTTGLPFNVSILLFMDLGCPCDPLLEYQIDIVPPFVISPSISNSGPICIGETANISLNINSQNNDLVSVQWSNGSTNKTGINVTPLETTTYSVTITYPCNTIVLSTEVIVYPEPEFEVAIVHPLCFEDCNGEITITSLQETALTDFSIDNGLNFQISNHFPGLCEGEYHIIVVDANTCSADTIVYLYHPEELITDIYVSSDFNGEHISCYGAADGSAIVFPSGGTGQYYYQWDQNAGNQTTNEAFNLPAGTYYVTVTDDNGCESYDEITLYDPPELIASVQVSSDYNGQNISCFGATDGSAIVQVSGGVQPYNYQWDANAGNQNTTEAIELSAGTYFVTVNDANNCAVVLEITLTEPDELTADLLVSSDFNGQDISCYGFADASAIVNATGGTGSWYYFWDENTGNQQTQEATNLSAGTYYVTIIDDNGCEIIEEITISQPDELITSIQVSSDFNGENISCYGESDGSAIVLATGGTGNHYFMWDANAGNQNTGEATGLSVGTYYVTITDDNGCENVEEITLTQPEELVSFTDILTNYNGEHISCHGESDAAVSVYVSGGTGTYYYQWDANAGSATTDIVTDLPAGTYFVTITDENACEITDQVSIIEPEELSASVDVSSDFNGQDISCFGASDGSAMIDVSGGIQPYSYYWDENTGDQTTAEATGLSAGTYFVTIYDSNDCFVILDITLTEPDELIISGQVTSDYNGQDISCFGESDGSAIINATGGTEPYSYLWDENAGDQSTQEATNISAGTYFVTVTDLNGCEAVEEISLSEPEELVASISVTSDHEGQNISCSGASDGSAMVVPSGGILPYSYLWDVNAGNQTTEEAINLSAGTYFVTVSDGNGCEIIEEITLTEPEGIYAETLVTSDFNGEDISCFGASDGSAISIASGGTEPYTYLWDENAGNQQTPEAINLSAGTYFVTITDDNNCFIVEEISLYNPVQLTAEINITSDYNGQDISCFGANDGSIAVSVQGGVEPYSYLWSENAGSQDTPQANELIAGTYFVSITDANSCVLIMEATISQPEELIATANVSSDFNGEDISCFGAADGAAMVNLSGGTEPFIYLWDENANEQQTQEASGLSAGTYYVTITDSNFCETTAEITLTEPEELTAQVLVSSDFNGSDISCFGAADGTATVVPEGGTEPYFYQWSENAGNQDTQEAVNLTEGTFYVTLTDSNGCESYGEIILNAPDELYVSIQISSDYNGEDISCYGGSDGTAMAIPSGGTAPYSYQWCEQSGEQQTQEAINLSAGAYFVTLTDSNACEAVAEITLSEPEELIATTYVTSNFEGQHISCSGANDGSAIVEVTGGLPPYSYLWDENAGNQITQEAIGLTAGTYYVSVYDDNGCLIVAEVYLIEPESMTGTSQITSEYNGEHISCFGASDGSAIVFAEGGTEPYLYLWDENAGNQNTQEALNLSAGTYTVTITDDNGCFIIEEITLLNPEELIATTQVSSDHNGSDISCYGVDDGAAIVFSSGGVEPYSFKWDENTGNQNTQEAINLTAGTYFITVIDANACEAYGEVTLIQPDELTAAVQITSDYNGENISCFGAEDGAAIVIPSGGTEPYHYQWDENAENQQTQEATNLSAGIYFVTITDENGCSITEEIILEQPEELTGITQIISDYNGANISCFGSSDGVAMAVPSGGIEPYSYLWDLNTGNQTTQEADNLSAQTYFVTVTDANGCEIILDITLSEPEEIIAITSVTSDFEGEDVSCTGASDGSAIVDVSGGVGTYTYLWDNNAENQTNPEAVGLSAGTYFVTVTDENNCEVIAEITLTEPESLYAETTVTSDYNGEDISCFDASDGSATVIVYGGVEPYQYLWDTVTGNQTSQEAFDLPAGTFFVTITDYNNCQIVTEVSLFDPVELTATTQATSDYDGFNISCYGFTDGSAIVYPEGGTAPYSFYWDENAGNQTSQEAFDLGAGNYFVTVTDANACTYIAEVFLAEPEQISAVTSVISDYNGSEISCYGASDGAVTVIANQGTPPYSYAWDENTGNQITQDATGLSAGTYFVTVTDVNGCFVIADISIIEPMQLDIIAEVTSDYLGYDISCAGFSDGSAIAIPQGGTAPYSYQWDENTGNQTSQEALDLGAGTYYVTVTDINNCTGITNITLTEPENFATVEVSSDYNGAEISCHGASDGAATVNILAGIPPYSIQWCENANHQTTNQAIGLSAGIYVVTVNDDVGCSIELEIELTQPDELLASVNVSSDYNGEDISCYGYSDGSATVSPSGGTEPYYYWWSANAAFQQTQEAVDLAAETYFVTVTDINGCSVTNEISLSEPEILTATAEINSNYNGYDVRCYGGSDGIAIVYPDGGTYPFTYLWDQNANNQTGQQAINLSAGTYQVTVTDSNNCPYQTFITLTEPEQITTEFLNVINTSCFGSADGSVISASSGGIPPYSYQWNDINNTNDSILSNVSGNIYTVTVTDFNNCKVTQSVLINQPPPISIQANITHVICGVSFGSVSINVMGGTPGYEYEWNDGQSSNYINDLLTGTYTLTVTDNNSCTNSISVSVNSQGNLNVAILEQSAVSCSGDSDGILKARVSSGVPEFSYQWSGTSSQNDIASGLSSGLYSVTVTDAWGCFGYAEYFLAEPIELSLSLTGTNISCHSGGDGTAQVIPSGGNVPYVAEWSTGATGFVNNDLVPGTYYVTVTDAKNCQATGSIIISEPDNPLAMNFNINDVSCYGFSDGSINLNLYGGTEPYAYKWVNSLGNTYSTPGISNIPAGFYYLTVTDSKNCRLDTTIIITGPKSPLSANYIKGHPSCFDIQDGYIIIEVNGGTDPYNFEFDGLIYDSGHFSDLPDGEYTINITDNRQCPLVVGPILLLDNEHHCLFIPDAITPNNDGINDTWEIENLHKYPDAKVSIYNRWGQLLWRGGNSVHWNGTYNGEILPTGTYLYVIELNEHFEAIMGTVSIVY